MKFKPFTQITFLSILSLFFFLDSNAQGEIKIKLSSITSEVEQKILPNDYIPSGFGLNNITLRLKNEGQNYWTASSSTIYKVKYDPATKHYDIGDDVYFTLKSTSKHYSLDKPMIIRIVAGTAFGNYIWTEVKRTRENLTEPLVLDHYSFIEGKPETAPRYYVSFKSKRFGAKLLEGDMPIKKNALTIKIRNVGQENYQAEHVQSVNERGRFNSKISLSKNSDPGKPIEGIASVRTIYGNYLWTTFKRNNDEIHKRDIVLDKYSGEVGNVNAPLSKPVVHIASEEEQIAQAEEAIAYAESIDKSEESSEVEETVAAAGEEAPKTTLALKQHKGSLEIANLPQEPTSGNIKSTLLESGSIIVGGQTFSLRGDMPINYNMEKGYILEAHSNGNQKIKTDYGTVTIKDGTPIRFSEYRPVGIILAEDVTLDTSYGPIVAKANHDNIKNDISFTSNGKLLMVTVANETLFKIGDQTFKAPAASEIKMSNDKMSHIQLATEIPYEIAGLKVTLMPGNSKSPSIRFSTKYETVSQIYVSNSSPITTSDGPLKVNDESAIRFDHDGTDYIVTRFEIGETKDLNLYRKSGKIKQKTAKRGKELVMVEGKVRRLAL